MICGRPIYVSLFFRSVDGQPILRVGWLVNFAPHSLKEAPSHLSRQMMTARFYSRGTGISPLISQQIMMARFYSRGTGMISCVTTTEKYTYDSFATFPLVGYKWLFDKILNQCSWYDSRCNWYLVVLHWMYRLFPIDRGLNQFRPRDVLLCGLPY